MEKIALKKNYLEQNILTKRFRIAIIYQYAAMAQQVEHVLGKDEVTGPNPVSSSKKHIALRCVFLFKPTVITRLCSFFHFLLEYLPKLLYNTYNDFIWR